MRSDIYYRITRTRQFLWNNRWSRIVVMPKKNFFVLPYERPYHRHHTNLWIDFLKTKHKKSRLFLHTVKIWHIRKRTRVLTNWKGEPLYEVMINVRNYGHKEVLKTVPV